MVRHSSKMLILGSLLVIFSLMLMFQPLFTWAQVQNDDHPCQISVDPEDDLFDLGNLNPGDSYTRTVKVTKTGSACANLYLTWDYIRGTPVLGKQGSLFEQLDLVIWETDRNGNRLRKVYEGKMSGATRYFEARWIAFMQYGDVVYLEITVSLPGPETGNEFQDSHLLTKLVFYTACCDEPGRPVINIEKFTNGVDADLPTGPFIPVGGAVTWTYVVTNTGNVPLSNVQVADNRAGVNPVYVSGDTNGDGILQVGETWIYRAAGIAVAGQYSNIGTVVGTPPSGPNVTDSDPSHYYGILPDTPAINIEKATNGVDADLPTGPSILVGGAVTWTYVVTNPGNVSLRNVRVNDNRTGVVPVYISGDLNGDGILQPGEIWTYRATGIAVAGQYSNIGTVIGTPPSGPNVTDSDPSHYFGVVAPAPPPSDVIVPPEAPGTSPPPGEVIVPPEGPKISPPLPRTDGISMSIFLAGLVFILVGVIIKKSSEKQNSRLMQY